MKGKPKEDQEGRPKEKTMQNALGAYSASFSCADEWFL